MAILACPECGGKVSSLAPSCPHCGFPMSAAAAPPIQAAPPPAAAPPTTVHVAAEPPVVTALPLEIQTPGGITNVALTRNVTVGRTQANLLVEHPDVVGSHCSVERRGDHWFVQSLGGALFVHGRKAEGGDLVAGEVIDLGAHPGAVALALPCTLGVPIALTLSIKGQDDAALQLQKLPMLIGRAPWADLPLEDRNVSHIHARLRIDAGRIVVDDLQSRNGTWVNETRAPAGQELRSGDVLRFGETELVIGERRPVETAVHALPAPARRREDADITPREMPDALIPPSLTIEQLAGPGDAEAHLPPRRSDVTQKLVVDTDACPACQEPFFLRRRGVITGVVRIAQTAVEPRDRKNIGKSGRCSSCGARLTVCPSCDCANLAHGILGKVVCRKCGEAFRGG